MSTSATPDRIDASRAALIVYDACRRALTPAKRRPSAFYGTGVSLDLDTVVVRECCWGGDTAAHAYSLDTAMKMYARVRTLHQPWRCSPSQRRRHP